MLNFTILWIIINTVTIALLLEEVMNECVIYTQQHSENLHTVKKLPRNYCLGFTDLNIPTMEEIGINVPEYQPLQVLWHSLQLIY